MKKHTVSLNEDVSGGTRKAQATGQGTTYNISSPAGMVNVGNIISDSVLAMVNDPAQDLRALVLEKGGPDAAEMIAQLDKAEAALKEARETGETGPVDTFLKSVPDHLAKHGWFYGALIQLMAPVLAAL